MKCTGNELLKGCGKPFRPRDTVCFAFQHYVEPYGPCLMGGGFYKATYYGQCPSCGVLQEVKEDTKFKITIHCYEAKGGIFHIPQAWETDTTPERLLWTLTTTQPWAQVVREHGIAPRRPY